MLLHLYKSEREREREREEGSRRYGRVRNIDREEKKRKRLVTGYMYGIKKQVVGPANFASIGSIALLNSSALNDFKRPTFFWIYTQYTNVARAHRKYTAVIMRCASYICIICERVIVNWLSIEERPRNATQR